MKTVIRIVFAIALVGLVALVVAPAFTPRRGCGNRSLRDSAQVRGLHQALVTWAETHPKSDEPVGVIAPPP